MPRRAAPGDRARIEGALTPALRRAIEELREVLDVDDWTSTPLGPVFATAAAVLEAGRLVRDGLSPTRALEVATVRLELEVEAVRSRASRWSESSREYVQHARGTRTHGVYSLIADAAEAPDTEDDAA